jgi:cellulose synthase/poly-beta-1,6-N-acetylglucosamine synthase-like glycosyltransferase
MWVAVFIVFLTFLFWVLGHEGIVRQNMRRPMLNPKNLPPVSVIIPAYKSERTIEQTLRSVKSLDYPKKEIIVINDSDDRTPQICKKYGVRLIQNKERMGKSVSLDMATKKAKNEILLFLDSDTVVEKDVLKKTIPWFYKPKVAVVMPTFAAKNNKGLSRLVSIENIFTHSHLRTHLYFGSLISFRGCCFVMRKSIVKKTGGWGRILTEDNDMGAKIVKNGYVIEWEPNAVAKTNEPETSEELKKQKIRWGAGSAYTFFRHRRYYRKSPQFLLYFFPYIILGFLVALLVLWHLFLFVFTLSLVPILNLIVELIIITIATYFHITVLVYSERGFINPTLLLKYVLYYLPLANLFYFKGVVKGIRGKKNKRDEFDLTLW